MGIYVLFFLLDFLTTYRIKEYLDYIEVNYLYQYIGLTGIFILNLLFIAFLWYYYKKGGVNLRFLFIQVMISTIAIRIFAIKNALVWKASAPTVAEVAATVTPQMKQATMIQIGVFAYVPLFLCLLAFFIWRLDHICTKKVGNSN